MIQLVPIVDTTGEGYEDVFQALPNGLVDVIPRLDVTSLGILEPAVIAILSILVAVAAFEIIALLKGWPTISQWLQRQNRNFPWFKWVIFSLLSFLAWHWTIGLPGKGLRWLRLITSTVIRKLYRSLDVVKGIISSTSVTYHDALTIFRRH